MPELPEVETVMRGLTPVLMGRRIARIALADLGGEILKKAVTPLTIIPADTALRLQAALDFKVCVGSYNIFNIFNLEENSPCLRIRLALEFALP